MSTNVFAAHSEYKCKLIRIKRKQVESGMKSHSRSLVPATGQQYQTALVPGNKPPNSKSDIASGPRPPGHVSLTHSLTRCVSTTDVAPVLKAAISAVKGRRERGVADRGAAAVGRAAFLPSVLRRHLQCRDVKEVKERL